MARKSKLTLNNEDYQSSDPGKLRPLEVKGRGKRWKVFYPDPMGMPSPVMVLDQEGRPKGIVYSGAPTGKMIESHLEPTTKEEAIAYAEFLSPGAEIKIIETSSAEEAAAIARAAARKKRKEEEDGDS